MSNNNLFKALSCQTRINVIERLIKGESHLSGLARELNISVPVMSRHVKILEDVKLIKKRIVGNVHLLSVDTSILEKVFDPFIEESHVKINKNDSILEILKQLPGFEIKKIGDNQYITSINGEKGHYIYQVNGSSPDISIDKFKPDDKSTIELKKIVTINKKRINVKYNQK